MDYDCLGLYQLHLAMFNVPETFFGVCHQEFDLCYTTKPSIWEKKNLFGVQSRVSYISLFLEKTVTFAAVWTTEYSIRSRVYSLFFIKGRVCIRSPGYISLSGETVRYIATRGGFAGVWLLFCVVVFFFGGVKRPVCVR